MQTFNNLTDYKNSMSTIKKLTKLKNVGNKIKNINFNGTGKYNILRIYTDHGLITIYPNRINGQYKQVDIIKIAPLLNDEYKLTLNGSYYNEIKKSD